MNGFSLVKRFAFLAVKQDTGPSAPTFRANVLILEARGGSLRLKVPSDDARLIRQRIIQGFTFAATITTSLTLGMLWADGASLLLQVAALLVIFWVGFPLVLWAQWRAAAPMNRDTPEPGTTLTLSKASYGFIHSFLQVTDDSGKAFRLKVYGPRNRVRNAVEPRP